MKTERENTIAPIGAQIRALRESRNLTLKELAEAVGTSAPAMHRYEGHWEGYTVRTLKRIAAALHADLEVRLRPRSPRHPVERSTRRPTTREFLTRLSNLFWDVDLSAEHLSGNIDWILTRVLNEGSLPQVRMALAYFGPGPFTAVLDRRGLTPRARSFVIALTGVSG